MSLLTINNLSATDMKTGKEILKNISFELFQNDFLGIVGESGSGKSMLMREILKVNPDWIASQGKIVFNGVEILADQVGDIRGKEITMILQDGMTAFNPLRKMGAQMSQTFRQTLGVNKKEALRLSAEGLKKLNFQQPAEVMNKYPHELSGGMLQRCMIAIALIMKPKVIIADEPTTALDTISQLEVVKEIERINEQEKISFILLSHDLGVVQRLAKRILVMKEGEVVESGTVEQVFNQPQAPYTQYLIQTRLNLSAHFRQTLSEGKETHD